MKRTKLDRLVMIRALTKSLNKETLETHPELLEDLRTEVCDLYRVMSEGE